MTVEEWLKKVQDRNPDTVSWSFPNDAIRDEYLSTIENRTWDEVCGLLRNFLLPSVSLGGDELTLRGHIALMRKMKKPPFQTEFMKRLYLFFYAKSRRKAAPPPWEGITWVLDLLPNRPRSAIRALDAYFEAHCLVLPDGRIHGLFDAMELIRARCIEKPRQHEDAIRLLLNESSRTFEHLVERLFRAMGYETTLTPRQKDGGFDVLAIRRRRSQRIVAHIEVKRWSENVGVPTLRALLGVVSSTKATNGICVTTSNLTKSAREFVDQNPRLDYMNGRQLVSALNEFLGPSWYFRIERLVAESKSETLSGADRK
jgi:restriction system protein